MENRCGSCRFFDEHDPIEGITYGWCRRYPPTVRQDKGNEEVPLHVPTNSTEWCGEWASIPPKEIKIPELVPHGPLSVRARKALLQSINRYNWQNLSDIDFGIVGNERNCGASTVCELREWVLAIQQVNGAT